jgi:quaternary ammonium compound-resistance protein SugE
MAWLILIVGGLCEVGWLIGLKHVNGLTRITPLVVTLGFMLASIGCLGLAIRSIPMGTAYAVWTGTSIAAVTMVGMFFFDESRDWVRLGSIALIVLGIVGLRLRSS